MEIALLLDSFWACATPTDAATMIKAINPDTANKFALVRYEMRAPRLMGEPIKSQLLGWEKRVTIVLLAIKTAIGSMPCKAAEAWRNG